MPWGGLTHPAIIKNKDDSFFGVIAYRPYDVNTDEKIQLPEFKNGWSLWIERQHCEGENLDYLVVGWNIFRGKLGRPINYIQKKVEQEQEGFYKVLQEIQLAISQVTVCEILENKALLNFLSFALAIKKINFAMPEVPLYLDALLTQDLDIEITKNNIYIGGKRLIVCSLLAPIIDSQMEIIYESLSKINYRHVRRLLLFDAKMAEKEEERYTGRWCSGRNSIKKHITSGILNKLNGYHMDSILILQDKEKCRETVDYIKSILNIIQLPYIFEEYNLKDTWWGSLPGVPKANITPPIIGFPSVDNLLAHKREKNNVQAEYF